MNSLTLFLEEHTGTDIINIEGIPFENAIFVKMLIDGVGIEELDCFDDSQVYFEELRESCSSSGNYLIFTCACGIAEDAGWDGVAVKIDETTVKWTFELGNRIYYYSFDLDEYHAEIKAIELQLRQTKLTLQPTGVIFPFEFKRLLET